MLLGNLLNELRENREMRALIICRSICSIEIEDSTAVIRINDENILKEIKEDSIKKTLDDFFTKRGLSLKFKCTTQNDEDITELKTLFGDKLKIKD